MVVEIDSDADAKTPPYTPVLERRLDAAKLLDPLKRVDPTRTVYTPPSNPPLARRTHAEKRDERRS
jgi:hypothetical protein